MHHRLNEAADLALERAILLLKEARERSEAQRSAFGTITMDAAGLLGAGVAATLAARILSPSRLGARAVGVLGRLATVLRFGANVARQDDVGVGSAAH